MRNVMLFRSEPKADLADWSPARATAFVEDPSAMMGDAQRGVIGVEVPADLVRTLRRTAEGGYMVPAHIARTAEPVDDRRMSTFLTMKDAYEEARNVRRSMGLTTVDCAMPGEMSPVARLLWRHLPEAAARVGVQVPDGEGGAVMQHLERDIERARPVSSYVACREDAAFLHRVCSGTDPATGVMRAMSGAAMSGAARTVQAMRAASDVGRQIS